MLHKLKQGLFQSAVQQDIRSRFDVISLRLTKLDRVKGRMIVKVDLFFTFHEEFNCMACLEFSPCSSKNVCLKLIMNKKDIEFHVRRDFRHILTQTKQVVREMQELVNRVTFFREFLFSKPAIAYRSNHSKAFENIYMNFFKCSRVQNMWTEKRLQAGKMVGQYVQRFGALYAVCTVWRRDLVFQLELYFPRLLKRYSLEIFDRELVGIDRDILKKLYEVPTSEILYVIEQNCFNYQRVKNELIKMRQVQKEIADRQKNAALRGVVKRLNEESISVGIARKKKNAEMLDANELLTLERSNQILSYYQWERLIVNMQLARSASGQLLLKICRFRAVLKEVLLEVADIDSQGQVYSFSVVLNAPHFKPANSFLLQKSVPPGQLQSFYFMMKVTKGPDYQKNDKLKMAEIMELYPHMQRKVEQGAVRYSDIKDVALEIYRLYRDNMRKHQLDYDISFYIYAGRMEKKQTFTSAIHKDMALQYSCRRYPILLSRRILTRTPSRILFVLLTDESTLTFMIYNVSRSAKYEKSYPMGQVDAYLPFFSHMMGSGQRVEAADRLYHTFKNTLLVDYYMLAENTEK